MADQDSQRGSFWTSLPGILTGAAALITAISGLAIWHNRSTPQPAPAPAPVVQPAASQASSAPAPVAATTPAVPIGSEAWCSEKYAAWQNEKQQTGVDDAGLRKEITQAHCNQFGIKLGRVKEQK
jgi:hypothetical protein